MGEMKDVPQALKDDPRWVCWRKQTRDGKATKLPVDAHTGRMAKSTDPATWTTFNKALEAAARLRCSGVGFVFGPDKTYTGLDLDHVLTNGVLADEFRWVVEAADTYTEVSPSGDGLHLIFRGSKPAGALRCRRGQPGGRVVEMYDHDRFFTVTGNVFEGHIALAENLAVVKRAYFTWIEPEKSGLQEKSQLPENTFSPAMELSDVELLERMYASKNGAALRALVAGDTSAYGGDHSAADMALCSSLAFWCAGDLARMDRIFRKSRLMRDKWDARRRGSTYGAQTLERAQANVTEYYRPRKISERSEYGVSSHEKKNVCSNDVSQKATTAGDASLPPQKFTGESLAHAPSVEGWLVDGKGKLWSVDRNGEPRYSITSTAPWIACDLIDVDSGDVRALVKVNVPGGTRERALDRDVLLNQSKVIGALAPLGANISSANAKDVVRYLTDCERRLGWERPRAKSVTHMGWADGPLGAFMPYDACAGGVRFDPSPDEAIKARPFLRSAGTLDDWVIGMSAARHASMAFRTVLAASFASPLVALLNVQTFIVYLWGRSRSGKTPTLKAVGSVWGDPTEGADSYFRTFADTPKSIVRAAALLHDMPVIIDELQSKGAPGGQSSKRKIVEDLLYSLSLGHERGALNSDRTMMHVGSWRCLTIATGEIPIVGDATQQGAANRTLELNAEPFSDARSAQVMHYLVAKQYGTAGRAFIEALRHNPPEFYDDEFSRLRDAVGAVTAGHPQADNIALLALADALAEFYIFSPGAGWQACLDAALRMARWALANATGSEGGDTDLKAIQFIAEWLTRNKIHFDDSAEMDRLERWGATEQYHSRPGFCWYVFSSVLDRALAEADFDRQKTLRRMADEGILLRGAGRGFARQKRFSNGSRVYCVCIDNEALDTMLDHGTNSGDSLSQGEQPC